ncbi:MAG: hypothetical protein M3R66_12300, partial [Actinomycetota bacterium]|nr:hypothetical protein [Actinomycetota bacterium]
MTAITARHRPVKAPPSSSPRRTKLAALFAMTGAIVLLGAMLSVFTPANAAPASVPLGTAKAFAILAGSTVTN